MKLFLFSVLTVFSQNVFSQTAVAPEPPLPTAPIGVNLQDCNCTTARMSYELSLLESILVGAGTEYCNKNPLACQGWASNALNACRTGVNFVGGLPGHIIAPVYNFFVCEDSQVTVQQIPPQGLTCQEVYN